MNVLTFGEVKERFVHRLKFRTRTLDPRRRSSTFSTQKTDGGIERIYVINLDRRPDRWRRQRKELNRFTDKSGKRLSDMARRFSAIDARYLVQEPDPSILTPTFTLADQLTVDPNPLLDVNDATRAHQIRMTRQEIAVALSHIEVWKLIAGGTVSNALILEDDVFLPIGFANNLHSAWTDLAASEGGQDFDLLYLSFKEVGLEPSPKAQGPTRRLLPGIWQASGYVLTQRGAQKLLEKLPVYGPIDLWLNMQFQHLNVFTAAQSIVEQNIDEPSTNSYSVLPVLSQVGVITREKPLLPTARNLKQPIIAIGAEHTGMTALAKALSMLGYTCCSDLDELPEQELQGLLTGRRKRLFNAYVNVGAIDAHAMEAIANRYKQALFITTSSDLHPTSIRSEKMLVLDAGTADKWAALTSFLGLEYPSFPYPNDVDLGQRSVIAQPASVDRPKATDLQFDQSPWIVRTTANDWQGFAVNSNPTGGTRAPIKVDWRRNELLDRTHWKLRDDTFPSNMALFTDQNFSEHKGEHGKLTLEEVTTSVRQYTSAAVASRESHLYGRFRAEMKAAHGPGLITGLFLHRNGPRQEIDIEILGKETTKMLVNVYYNPGPEGTKLEYGYRGTPTEIELGFDAAADFHVYEIEWQPDVIVWKVDGVIVYERKSWNPTPIPDQPLEFNLNLWHSRSIELAGKLAASSLPASVEIRSVEVHAA